jgi:hypothetical protein
MQVKHKVNVKITDDAAGKDVLFGLDDTLAEVSLTSFTKYTSGRVSVAAAVDETINLGDIAAVKGLYLKADADCQIKLNNNTETLQLRKGSTSTGTYARFFMEGDITSLEVTTAADTPVNIIFCAWGDSA